MSAAGFASRLLDWFVSDGRHDLPWQGTDPYRVWVSEIMLQQTQVATVIPYYLRFVAHFPDVRALAHASLDEVLGLWSGLGYYARARNLHSAARCICDAHGGVFPMDFNDLQAMPGIGRSTAGAILALARGERHPVLDGNVRRVLARHAGVGKAAERELWKIAEARTPYEGVGEYTQAIMDLGATVCTRVRPRCGACPVADDCIALREDRIAELSASRPRKPRPVRRACMLLLRDPAGAVLLERRPPSGIWGGLWCLPQSEAGENPCIVARERYGLQIGEPVRLAVMRHAFTHFRLDIEPVTATVAEAASLNGTQDLIWAAPDSLGTLGMPAPVRKLLEC